MKRPWNPLSTSVGVTHNSAPRALMTNVKDQGDVFQRIPDSFDFNSILYGPERANDHQCSI